MDETLTLPGFVDAHSHTFQRALRGRAGGEDFWAWRELMLAEAERQTPELVRRSYADTYRELRGAGYTAVGEFHYLGVEEARAAVEAASEAGVARFVIVSSIGAQDPEAGGEAMLPYLRAKAEADRAVAESDRAWTVVRPGQLTDDPGTGRAGIGTEAFRGEVTRDDVAAVLAAVLHEPASVGKTLYVASGDDPIEEALAAAV